MNCAASTNADSACGSAGGGSVMLGRRSSEKCAGVTTMQDDAMRAVMQPNDSIHKDHTLIEHVDSVLIGSFDEVSLCNAPAAQRYIAPAQSKHESLRDVVRELVCGDDVAAGCMLSLIRDTNRTTLAWLCDRFEAASWDEASSAAHRIAGSARMLGSGGLLVLLTRLEAATRERNIPLAKALLPQLINAIESLDVSLQAALASDEQD